MKLVIRPIQDRQRELDVTHRLVSAIADELWKLYGGNDQLNWLEAELHLQRIVGRARAEARETEEAIVAPSGAAVTAADMPDEWVGRSDHDESSALSRATRRRAPAVRRGREGRGDGSSGRTRPKRTGTTRAVAGVAS